MRRSCHRPNNYHAGPCQKCARPHEPECHLEKKKQTRRRKENRKHACEDILSTTKSQKLAPVLPCTTKLAETRSSTTVYYATRTNRSSTTVHYKTRRNTFHYYRQYYRILQSLHKTLPNTTVTRSFAA